MPPRRVTFQLGQVVLTNDLRAALNGTGEDIQPYIERFRHGDWGMILEDDKKINNEALLEDHGGGALVGIYQLRDRTPIWIQTSEDRTVTVVDIWTEKDTDGPE